METPPQNVRSPSTWREKFRRKRKWTIHRKYISLGGAKGVLGEQKSSSTQETRDGKGRFKEFQNGVICWFPHKGVHEVHGAILHKWNSLGRETGWLGYPVSDEISDASGEKRHSDFQNGSIYWSEQAGGMALRAPILALWRDFGGETGRLGYPTSDERPGPYTGSIYLTFQNGSSVYWDEERGAYEVFPLPEPPEQSSGAGVWWSDLHDSKVVGIHAALLHTGRVLFFSHGNPRVSISGEPTGEVGSAVLEPLTAEVSQQQLDDGVICSGHTFLADGRLLACGSERRRDGVHAIRVFTPAGTGGEWQHIGELEEARWYPTCTRLHDGRILIVGGHKWFRDGNTVNATYEVFDPNRSTRDRQPIPFLEHSSSGLFPFVFVLPSRKLLIHAGTETSFLDLHQLTFETTTLQAADRPDRNSRTYDVQGTAVMLPMLPDSTPAYRAKVMLIGGGGSPTVTARTRATNSCEILDLGESSPAWRLTEPMANERVMCDAVILPDGTVLVTNGSFTGTADSGANPVLAAELYDPVSEKWTTLSAMKTPRLYHSVALLLPDGRVLTAGTDSVWHQARLNKAKLWVETFSPPYLDRGPRPIIQNAPVEIGYHTEFEISAPLAQAIKSVALISPGSVTHSFNSSQRYVGLSIIRSSASSLSVMSPPDPYVAPPGYYMLFIVNDDGVPSVSRFIKLDQQ